MRTDQFGIIYGAALSKLNKFMYSVKTNQCLLLLVCGGLFGYYRTGSVISLVFGS